MVLMYLARAAKRTRNDWDDSLLNAVGPPLRAAMWIIGITIAAGIAARRITADGGEPSPAFALIEPTREVGILVCLGWMLQRLIRKTIKNLQVIHAATGGQKGIDEQTGEAIRKLLQAAVSITLVLVILQTLGFSISGVMAFGGVGGIAIGFAAKDLLANFFGGLFIYLDKPFAAGDWIRSPDQDIEGTVESIGWRRTVIRRFNKRPLYVPNATFNNISVENPSRMTNRRIFETVGIRYDDAAQVSNIVDEVKYMLRQHEEIDQKQTMIVNFDKFGASSLDFFVYTFTKTTDWVRFHEIKQDVLLKIYAIVERNGGEMAFPTQTLHIASDDNSQQVSDVGRSDS